MQIQPRIGFSAQPPFSPRQIPNLWGWFDANNVKLDGNGRVSELKLIAGSGSDITQSTSAKRPNHGTVNGTDTIQFNPNAAGDTQHALPSAGPSGATGQTVTFVGQIVSGSGSFYEWATGAEIKANNSEPDWRWANDESVSELRLVRSGPRVKASLNIGNEDSIPTGEFISDDETKLYVMGFDTNTVYQYALSTAGDLNTAGLETSFDVSGQAGQPHDVFIGDSGSKMYVVDRGASTIFQYTLSTAWDVPTASFDNTTIDVNNETTDPVDIFIGDNGGKLYVTALDSGNIVQYTLSTPWDINTASFDKEANILSSSKAPQGIHFKNDGTKMFVADAEGANAAKLFQYGLSTAWDVGSFNLEESFDVLDEDDTPRGVSLNPKGNKIYMTGQSSTTMYQYQLINKWDISSGNFDALSLVHIDDTQAKVYINGQFVQDFDPADNNIQGNTPDFIADNGEADFNLRAFTVHEAALSAGQISQLHAYFLSRWL